MCQRPRFGDDVCTDICVCTSFINSIDPWLQQSGNETAFKNLQTCNYDAVDSWLHSPVDDTTDLNLQTSNYDAMMDFSTLHTRPGLYTLSPKDMSSSATSATSTSPSYERRSPEAGHRDWPLYHCTMNSKLVRKSIEFICRCTFKLTHPQKRREQNRNSQRSFRERKNQMTKDLQDRVEELTKLNETLNHEVSALRKELGRI